LERKYLERKKNPISSEIKDRILQLLFPQVDISKNIGINTLKTYFSKPLKTSNGFLAKFLSPKENFVYKMIYFIKMVFYIFKSCINACQTFIEKSSGK
jgi:hypothetical protein